MMAYEGYLDDGRYFSPLGVPGAGVRLKGRQKVIMTLIDEGEEESDIMKAKREASQKLWEVLMAAEKEAEEKGWLTEEEADALIDSL